MHSMPNTMPELEKLSGVGLHRLIIPSSFVATISGAALKTSQDLVTLADFRLGAGAWIVQAKAIVKASGGTFDPEHPNLESGLSALLHLEASTQDPIGQKGTVATDDAKLFANNLGSTLLAIVGIEASTIVSVVLI